MVGILFEKSGEVDAEGPALTADSMMNGGGLLIGVIGYWSTEMVQEVIMAGYHLDRVNRPFKLSVRRRQKWRRKRMVRSRTVEQ